MEINQGQFGVILWTSRMAYVRIFQQVNLSYWLIVMLITDTSPWAMLVKQLLRLRNIVSSVAGICGLSDRQNKSI